MRCQHFLVISSQMKGLAVSLAVTFFSPADAFQPAPGLSTLRASGRSISSPLSLARSAADSKRSAGRLLAESKYALGIDVGTGSARCGVFSLEGKLLGSYAEPITMFQPEGPLYSEFYQQSSENIWSSICLATSRALKEADVDGSGTVGIGFDATCSLVCLGDDDKPRGVDPTCPDDHERNIIVWLDHRATGQAARINAAGHSALKTVGGTISPEMEVPKLLWLKEKMPDRWLGGSSDGYAKFFDLPDYLVYRSRPNIRIDEIDQNA